MFWRSPKGLFAVVPSTAILSYMLLMQLSEPADSTIIRVDAGGRQLSSQPGALEERALAKAFEHPDKGLRLRTTTVPWVIQGRVVDRQSRPLGGVRIQVGVDKAGLIRRIARTRTDERGRWSASLEDIKEFSAAFRDGARILVHFEAKDLPDHDRFLELPALDAERFSPRLSVELGSGCKITGRVLDRDHRPVPKTFLYLSGPGKSSEFFGRQPETQTNSLGRFEIIVRTRGHHVLQAFRPGVGSSKRISIDFVEQTRIDTPDLFVGSGESVTGKIQYEDGSPVSSAWLRARIHPAPAGREPRVLGDRVEELLFQTDAAGQYSLGGLETGSFVIGDPTQSMEGFSTPLQTGQSAARITIHRQRLKIRIRDRDGWALPGTKIHLSTWTGDDARIALELNRDRGSLAGFLGRASRRQFLTLEHSTGNLDLWVERGTYCWIRLAIPGCRPASRGILIDPKHNEGQLDIVVQNR